MGLRRSLVAGRHVAIVEFFKVFVQPLAQFFDGTGAFPWLFFVLNLALFVAPNEFYFGAGGL